MVGLSTTMLTPVISLVILCNALVALKAKDSKEHGGGKTATDRISEKSETDFYYYIRIVKVTWSKHTHSSETG